MTRMSLTDGWRVRRASGPFSAVGGELAADSVRLPHDALRDVPRTPDAPGRGAQAYYPGGAFTYLRELDVPEEWRDRTVVLELQGVFRRAQVFVDDELVGNRADGYARFFLELSPYLRYGATSTLRVEARAGEDSRWYSGAGLHRPVALHVLRPVHIVPDGVVTETTSIEGGDAVVEVRTTVRNTDRVTRTVRVASEVRAVDEPDSPAADRDDTPITLAPGESGVVRHRLAVRGARLWSPDDPALYSASVHVDGEDPVVTRFGIRRVTADPRHGLRINGAPVLLRGACVHHDNGPLGAAAIDRAEERRVELLQEAGFNAIRAAHNPLSEAMLEACDRLGMLVIDEAFDMWTRFKTPFDYAADFPQWWAEDLRAMIDKDRNHPSVIMYSLGNEIAETGTPHGARWARRMAEHVRSLDPTRLVTNGVNALLAVIDEVPAIVEELGGLNQAASQGDPFNEIGSSELATLRTEESSSVLDVLGLNYADARYAADAERFPHRVIVGSETFPRQIGRLWPMVESLPHVIGDFTWTGWDYLGEVGIGSTAYADDPDAVAGLEREFPFLTAWSGDIDITGWRRPMSYYREIAFGRRSEPYLAVRRPAHYGSRIAEPSPWAWSDSVASWTWNGHEGRPVEVEVYARAERVELLLDGTPVGSAAVGGSGVPLLAVITTEYRPGRLEAVAYDGDREVGRHALATAGSPRLVVSADRAEIRAGDADLAFVALELRDADGVLVADADTEVTVSVTGAAELAGMASANPKTTERFADATWRTFDGRAIAVVRPTGTGTARVTARSAFGESAITLTVTDL